MLVSRRSVQLAGVILMLIGLIYIFASPIRQEVRHEYGEAVTDNLVRCGIILSALRNHRSY